MTRKVDLFLDLDEGWQDKIDSDSIFTLFATNKVNSFKPMFGQRRIKIVVELPCFGGSCDVSQTIQAPTSEVKQFDEVGGFKG